nr:hypothetical protein [Paracoccus versutus]
MFLLDQVEYHVERGHPAGAGRDPVVDLEQGGTDRGVMELLAKAGGIFPMDDASPFAQKLGLAQDICAGAKASDHAAALLAFAQPGFGRPVGMGLDIQAAADDYRRIADRGIHRATQSRDRAVAMDLHAATGLDLVPLGRDDLPGIDIVSNGGIRHAQGFDGG